MVSYHRGSKSIRRITKALREYEREGDWNGNLSLSSIVVKNNDFYLIDKDFFSLGHFSAAKLRIGEHFCSPEYFNHSTISFSEPLLQNPITSDVFSLGIVILKLLLPGCTL